MERIYRRFWFLSKVFTAEGLKQFAKNKVDPATIPYIGALFHAKYAGLSVFAINTMCDVVKATNSLNEQLTRVSE